MGGRERVSGNLTHETMPITGEIETGDETDLCFILNRHARQSLAVSHLDSSHSSRSVECRAAA